MRWLRRLSVRARITIGSVLVGAVVLTLIALVLHVEVRQATLETDRSLAAGDAAPFVSDLRQNPDEQPDRPAEGVLVGIRSSTGAWIVDTLPEDLRRALPDGVPTATTTLRLGDGHRQATVVGTPVENDDGRFVVWAAHDGRAGHETVERVDRSLVVGTLLALVASGLAAWSLSTVALRPVTRMRRTAEALSGGEATGHLPVGPSEDELADLARTLNAFIDRQRENAARERRMVSDASHELRTPLAALTARLELAHRSSGDAVALERELAAAESDAARLTALAETMLELSRLDETQPTPSTPAAALVTELMGSVDRARALGGTGGVDFTVDVPDGDERYAVTPAAFGRIVDNLVANSIAAGAPAVEVRIELAQRADRALDLVVRDDGPGVPEDFLPHAFDRFTRADDARRAVLGGSGLGLALVRGIAERAGGDATLANAPEGGAVAVVRLPAR
ncbi:ATP-binding protein [Curtobacterium sp. RHCJP20]|uniref:histidine kinase n=1 Tax=Curtobacterium subtropicum TaxID=3055138 RepID=A0ABT7THZ0_9MICO|nr:ATP-binding protein [Curtobacterium subtropicum]MDM7889198.1 ATP-binding protein [Curtobacterium subtropicum]